MIKVFIKSNEVYHNPLIYTLNLLNEYLPNKITYVDDKLNADFIFDHTDEQSLTINIDFFNDIVNNKKFRYDNYFNNEPIIFFKSNRRKDYLGTVFYLINCLQEFDSQETNNYDHFGRFKFERTLQNRFNCIEENLVEKYLIEFCKSEFNITNLKDKKLSKVFLSHDIDSINGSFLQDGKWAIKNGRLDVLFKLIFNEVTNKPDWKNIDFISNLHCERGLKSAFFWLATNKSGRFNVKNADYDLEDIKQLSSFTKINGIHKSSCVASINYELESLPFQSNINRQHFLMFDIPKFWDEIEISNLKLDASLGFAERYGFRNSFALPFRPYNFSTGKEYSFVEVPLNIMDGTFHKYMEVPVKETANKIINFLEINKYNSILSILWHNTFFTNYKYKGYLEEYKKVLSYLIETKIDSITPNEIIRIYGS